MSGPFKLKYKNSAFPFKEDDEKKKAKFFSIKPDEKGISDDIGYDKEYDIFFDKDIQRSYERGTYTEPRDWKPKELKKHKEYLEWRNNPDIEV